MRYPFVRVGHPLRDTHGRACSSLALLAQPKPTEHPVIRLADRLTRLFAWGTVALAAGVLLS
jgi:hypothetical protein